MMSKVTLWKKKMDEYYARVNSAELKRDLGNAGFKTGDALHPSIFAFHEVAATVEAEDENKHAAVSYAI